MPRRKSPQPVAERVRAGTDRFVTKMAAYIFGKGIDRSDTDAPVACEVP